MVNTLIVIVGPTAVGKTELAIRLANEYRCDIISADSRQFYKDLEIGTAKPSGHQLKLVRHHFINSLNLEEEYNAGHFERDVIKLLNGLFVKKPVQIMVGGSGMYVDAVCYGFDKIPTVPLALRRQLNLEIKEEGLNILLNELQQKDPEYFQTVDQRNPRRIVRALEVIRFTGKPYSSFRQKNKQKREFRSIIVGIEIDRDKLYKKIDRRMDRMIENGLFEEAEKFYPERHLNSLQTVGYKEIFDYLDGKYDYQEALRLLKRNSRRYAKRQLTWFKNNAEIRWFHPDEHEKIIQFLNKLMS
jgi:tRNA dimethylallyltransferase